MSSSHRHNRLSSTLWPPARCLPSSSKHPAASALRDGTHAVSWKLAGIRRRCIPRPRAPLRAPENPAGDSLARGRWWGSGIRVRRVALWRPGVSPGSSAADDVQSRTRRDHAVTRASQGDPRGATRARRRCSTVRKGALGCVPDSDVERQFSGRLKARDAGIATLWELTSAKSGARTTLSASQRLPASFRM
jgi:hypothetical protein